MKGIKKLYAILGGCIFLLIVSCGDESNSSASDNKNSGKLSNDSTIEIPGFWNNTWPAAAELHGYCFFPDNTYVFIWGGSLKSNFEGSYGKWKIDGTLYILPQRNIMWKKNWVEGASGGIEPGVNNEKYAVELKSGEWIMISDFNSFIDSASSPKDKNIVIPPSLNIKYYIGDIRNSVRFYKTHNSGAEAISFINGMLEKYKSIKVR